MMKSSNLVGFVEGKEHDSSKGRDRGSGSSISSHVTVVGGMNLYSFSCI